VLNNLSIFFSSIKIVELIFNFEELFNKFKNKNGLNTINPKNSQGWRQTRRTEAIWL